VSTRDKFEMRNSKFENRHSKREGQRPLFHFAFLISNLLVLCCTATAAAQPAREQTVEVDPLRCWWRASDGAVMTGQPFSVTLTCAVLENPSVRVVPDESQLAVETIQLAPFELIGGTHPEDLRSGLRRFFQYEYRLRLIDPSAIGKDVDLPAVVIHYRVESRVQAQTSEGRDLTYVVPALPIRVLSTVPADAADIRDGSDEPFGAIEALRFRARVLDMAAIALAVFAGLVLIPVVIRAFVGVRKHATEVPAHLSDRAVLQGVAAELAAVRDESRGGWSPGLVARALTAVRIAAAYALGRRVAQRIIPPTGEVPDARLVIHQGLLRKRKAAVTSPVTAADVERALEAQTAATTDGRRVSLETLQSSLAVLTQAQYAVTPGELTFDDNIGAVLDVVGRLRREHGWLRRLRLRETS
jgi:hypothetical protein